MTDLKPCPFCGSDDIRREYGAGSKPPYNDPYVVCVDCGASVAGKAGAWNTRADLAAERERKLVVALDQAAQALDWAARKMKGRCTGTAVDAAMVAAGNATAVRKELGYE